MEITITGFTLYNGTFPAQVIAYTPGQHCSYPQINNLGQVAWINWNGNATPYSNIYFGMAPIPR